MVVRIKRGKPPDHYVLRGKTLDSRPIDRFDTWRQASLDRLKELGVQRPEPRLLSEDTLYDHAECFLLDIQVSMIISYGRVDFKKYVIRDLQWPGTLPINAPTLMVSKNRGRLDYRLTGNPNITKPHIQAEAVNAAALAWFGQMITLRKGWLNETVIAYEARAEVVATLFDAAEHRRQFDAVTHQDTLPPYPSGTPA